VKAIKLTGVKKLTLAEVDKPAADHQSVIIKVAACGICGSDLHYWELGEGMAGARDLIMGHELTGIVEDAGNCQDLKVGERVTAVPMNACGECLACQNGLVHLCVNATKRPQPGQNGPGAYAEYFAARPDMVRRLPPSVSDSCAALIEPSAVALHAIKEAGVERGDSVLVTGAGTIGLLCAAWARIYGASFIAIIDANKARVERARNLSEADLVLEADDPKINSKLKKATGGGVHVAIDTSAADPAINMALLALRPKGTLGLVGISFKPQSLTTIVAIVKEIAIKPVYAYLPNDFDLVIDAINRGVLKVERLITKTIGFEEMQRTFEDLASGKSSDLKILVQPK
jgi:2-desacetyl-2-hydroxyethyl bacteriochlorophyllide A dehydrogenase